MNTLKDKAEFVTGETTTIERRIFVNSIRNMAASLAVAITLATFVNTQAHSAPIPHTLQTDPEVPSITTNQQQDEVRLCIRAVRD